MIAAANCVVCRTRPPRTALTDSRACNLCTAEFDRDLYDLHQLLPVLRALLEPSRLSSADRYGTVDCLFATVPDEPLDHAETRRLWTRWRDTVAGIGVPVAFVAQEGSERTGEIPWEELAVVFLGGGDPWKDGAGGRRVAAEAHERGVPVHVGRVNSWRRYQHGVQILRARTCDGTTIARRPHVE